MFKGYLKTGDREEFERTPSESATGAAIRNQTFEMKYNATPSRLSLYLGHTKYRKVHSVPQDTARQNKGPQGKW